MSEADSKLISVLEAALRDEYADEDTGELSLEESRGVRGLIRDCLEIADSPSERDPYQIADFIYWNCESASRDAADRWLRSLTAKQLAGLGFGDVLAALAPGLAGDIEELAEENEAERRDEKEG
jgi:hypothetical protein